MIILGFDPGESTGYGVVDTSMQSEFEDPIGGVVCKGVLDLWRGVEKLVIEHQPDVIVVEKFILYPGKAAAQSYSPLLPVQVIGVVKYVAEQHAILCIEQPAHIGKQMRLSDELYAHLRNKHVRDAFRHIAAYVYSKGG